MRPWIISIGVVAALAAGVFFFATDSGYSITNYPPQNPDRPIVAFGDSLVAGVGSTEGGDFISVLEQKTGEQIINAGVAGNTTADGLARVEDDVLAHDPRMVLVLLGGNDYLKRVPKEQTRNNLRQLVARIQERGAIVAVLGVRGGVLVDTYEEIYKDVARETGSIYVPDVLDGLIGESEYMFDAIHPNNTGYAIMADRVYEHVQPYLDTP